MSFKSRFVAAIFNFSETLKVKCTSPCRWECDSRIRIISDCKILWFLRPQNYEVDPWRPFCILIASLKTHLHISILSFKATKQL